MVKINEAISSVTLPEEFTKRQKKNFYNLPTSPASNLVMETLGAGDNVADLKKRKKKIDHSTKYEILENGKSRRVIINSPTSEVTIELSDIDKLTGSNKPAKKLFIFSLIKANEHAIFDGRLAKNCISFPLQELIDIGFYQTAQSARKGFKDGMDALTSLKIKGHIQESKTKNRMIESLEVLFTGANIKNGECSIYLNERINWSFIMLYFTILPRYYFKLTNRASDLLYYIFYLARQHTKDIQEKGYFTISFRAIQSKLQLPNEVGNTRPQQTIKQPIDEAIEQIETEHNLQYGNMEFQLLPCYDENANIVDFLNNGYLKVTLKGGFAQTFIQISQKAIKKIEQAEKQRNRVLEKALAIKTSQVIDLEKSETK